MPKWLKPVQPASVYVALFSAHLVVEKKLTLTLSHILHIIALCEPQAKKALILHSAANHSGMLAYCMQQYIYIYARSEESPSPSGTLDSCMPSEVGNWRNCRRKLATKMFNFCHILPFLPPALFTANFRRVCFSS